jgi:hypothetical protein
MIYNGEKCRETVGGVRYMILLMLRIIEVDTSASGSGVTARRAFEYI